MDNFSNFISGVGQVLVLDNGMDYVRPSRNDFSRDISALKSDAKRLGVDFTRTAKNHGKQVNNRKG